MPFFLESKMENEMLTYFCWFLGGAVSYKTLAYAFNLGTAINIYNKTLNGCIVMLNRIDEQRLISLSQKHIKLKQDGVEEEEFEKEKKNDIENHHLWREMMITIILISCPKSIKSSIRFKDWNSAMKLLNK